MKANFNIKILLIFFVFFLSFSQAKSDQNTVDIIIFSFDRPLQLYALLESIETYMSGVGDIRIIYRSSNNDYENGYQIVKENFPNTIFLKQGANPKKDFKPLTMKSLRESQHGYIVFAVDDIIVKDFVDLEHAAEILRETNAYGFYLRLGLHITYCYAENKTQPIPKHNHVIDNVYSWHFKDGRYDWCYPNTVDMTIYKKDEILKEFPSFGFSNPNTLEANWHIRRKRIMHRKGLCCHHSKIINIPVNRVQNTFRNRNMNSLSPKELLEIFYKGLKVDIAALFKINNKGVHEPYNLTFVNI